MRLPPFSPEGSGVAGKTINPRTEKNNTHGKWRRTKAWRRRIILGDGICRGCCLAQSYNLSNWDAKE